MEVVAQSKSVKISPRKVQLVADAVRNLPVMRAQQRLQLTKKRGAYVLLKTLKSAIANAVNNAKLKEEDLMIARLEVTEGPFLKRFHPSTRGRIHPYKRRSSHIKVILKEFKGGKNNGTEN